MNVSAHVDVVMADGTPDRTPLLEQFLRAQYGLAVKEESSDDEAGTQGAPDQVDVSPDPDRRIIVLAPTKAEGYDEARALGIEPVAVITPRSPAGGHGVIADELMYARNLTPEVREALLPHALPSLATSGND